LAGKRAIQSLFNIELSGRSRSLFLCFVAVVVIITGLGRYVAVKISGDSIPGAGTKQAVRHPSRADGPSFPGRIN